MRWIWLGATLAAATASTISLLFLVLSFIMRSGASEVETIALTAFCVVIAVFVIAVILAFTTSPPLWRFVFPTAIAVILIAGFVPHLLSAQAERQVARARAAADQAFEAKVVADIAAIGREVDRRIAEKRPYTPQEMLAFLNFVGDTNLTYRSRGDHSPEALALLKRALDAKLVDPNAMVRGPRPVDVADVPLFLQFYRSRIRWSTRPPGAVRVDKIDWDIFRLLAAGGADLAQSAAAPAVEDLQRKATVDDTGRYLELE